MSKRSDDNNENEFLNIVFPAELEEIDQRRNNANLEKEPVSGKPSTEKNLVGLALSGGGIRSATFSLGIIQGLARHGLLKHVDYLSTVSGGGYIGSCLSALLNDPRHGTDKDNFPLRAYEVGPHWNKLPKLIAPLLLVFLVMALSFPFILRSARVFFSWSRRNSFELWLTVPLLLALIIMFSIPFLGLTRWAIESSTGQFVSWYNHLTTAEILQTTGIVFGFLFALMLAGKASLDVSRFTSKLLIWFLGLLGPAIIFAIYLGLCLWQIDSPFIPAVPQRVSMKRLNVKHRASAQRRWTRQRGGTGRISRKT